MWQLGPELGRLSRALSPQVRAMRLSFVGELGWELHVPRPACVPVYQAVMTAGAKHGLVNAGYRAIDSLSIEKGVWEGRAAPVGRPEPCCRPGTVAPHTSFLPCSVSLMPASPARGPRPCTLPALPVNAVSHAGPGDGAGVPDTCTGRASGRHACPGLGRGHSWVGHQCLGVPGKPAPHVPPQRLG